MTECKVDSKDNVDCLFRLFGEFRGVDTFPESKEELVRLLITVIGEHLNRCGVTLK